MGIDADNEQTVMPEAMSQTLEALRGKVCWNVGAGGSVGSSFSLAFGGRIPRERPLNNPMVSDEFRSFEGEYALLVWCSWRLDGREGSIVSSDLSPEIIDQRLETWLIGAKVIGATVQSRAWDMRLDFSGDLTLQIFCDRLPDDEIVDPNNWDIRSPSQTITVGPGFHWVVEPTKAP